MCFNAPTGSFLPCFAAIGVASKFVGESCCFFAAFFFAAASGAVVPKIGGDAVGVAVCDVFVVLIFALCFRLDFGRVVAFVLLHHCLEDFLEGICGESSVGSLGIESGICFVVCNDGGISINWCRWLRIGILVFVVHWFLLVERHVVDKLLKFLVDEIGDKGCLIGRVAGGLGGQVVFHAVFVFDCHDCFENSICFGGVGFCAPDLEGIIEEASCIDVVVTESKQLRVRDVFFSVFGEDLTVLKLFEEVSNGCGWIPLSIH